MCICASVVDVRICASAVDVHLCICAQGMQAGNMTAVERMSCPVSAPVSSMQLHMVSANTTHAETCIATIGAYLSA